MSQIELRKNTLTLWFAAIGDHLPEVRIVFSDTVADVFAVGAASGREELRLETLERVRFEYGSELLERSAEGLVFFLIELLPDVSIEIRTRSAKVYIQSDM